MSHRLGRRGGAPSARPRCPVAAWAAAWLCVASVCSLAADAADVAGLVSLLLPSFDGDVDATSCPDLYRRYSRRHTQCVRPPKSCHPLHEGVSEADRQLIVDQHNAFRNRLASGAEAASGLPAAANMMYLEWNEELATVAQKLASMCAVKPDCADCRRVESFTVGQNICNYKIRSRTAPPIYWRSTIAYWYDGVKQFPPAAISPYIYRQHYGTFSQMVWAKTWSIGCGYSLFTRRRWFVQSYVCNYGPAGNYLKSRVYLPGEPCTRCEPGTRCVGNSSSIFGGRNESAFSSLCKSETEAGPQVTLPAGTIFYCNFHTPSLDCPIKEEPYGSFQVRRLIGGGGYLTTTVGQNESAAVTLDRVLAVPDNDTEASTCLRFRFRKGPFRDGAGGSSQLHVRLSVLDRNVIKSSTLTRHYSHWTPYSITITRPIQVQLTLLLKVATNSPPQYFDLTDVLLASNPC
nr:CRISP/Allergen/PR-1-like isoform X2 [Dermacentor andersoni]